MAMAIEDIEKAIEQLPKDQLQSFRAWFERFDADIWDKQISRDVESGRLDDLANAAISDHLKGKTTRL